MESKKFAIIGGDKRNYYLANELKQDGHTVKLFGFSKYDSEGLYRQSGLYETIDGADYIIGGIPASNDGLLLNMPYENDNISAEDLFRLIKKHQVYFAGYIKSELVELAERFQVNIVDVLKKEELSILNAIPTAFGKKV